MKRFMRLMLASSACLTLSVAMVAQEAQTTGQVGTTDTSKQADSHHQHHRGKMGRMGGAQHMQKMATELNLTEAQKTQLKGIHEQQRTKMQELRANTSLTKEQKMEQAKALRESTHSQMTTLLTPEQQTKFTEMKANRKARVGKHGKHGRRGAWGEKNKSGSTTPDSTQK
jgi:Spy/CpxP family protein refolding chaperone